MPCEGLVVTLIAPAPRPVVIHAVHVVFRELSKSLVKAHLTFIESIGTTFQRPSIVLPLALIRG